LTTMRTITLSAFLIVLALSIAEEDLPSRLWQGALAGTALDVLQVAVWALLLTPVVIAVHRFVILGEATRTYRVAANMPAFRVFFGWLFALKVLLGLPFDLLDAFQKLDWSRLASMIAFLAAIVAVIALWLRLAILLPALAVDAPGATPSHALADSKGQALRILTLFCAALLPWPAVGIGGVLLLGPGVQVLGSRVVMISLVLGASLQTIMLLISAVTASYVFMILAARLKQQD
jgi:hypothetical protein